jgi:integrase
VPSALRAVVGKREINQTLGTKDWTEAVSRFLPIAAEIDQEWARLRHIAEHPEEEPKRLTVKQIQGLAGEFYRWFIGKHDDNPGSAKEWEDQAAADLKVIHPPLRRLGAGFTLHRPEVDEFLKERGISLDEANLFALRWATGTAGMLAKQRLARIARHDYSEDSVAQRFPKWSEVGPTLTPPRVLTLKDRWDEFAQESQLKPGTVKRWRPVLEALCAFAGTDNLAEITDQTMVDWKKHLLDHNRANRTINDVYFAAARSFFNWAVDNKKADANPAAAVKVRDRRVKENGKALSEQQAEAILRESLRPSTGRVSQSFAGAKRWTPWGCAYSGARLNEFTQLRGADIRKETIDGVNVWVMRITPEAGTVKNGVARDVPIHPHLIEQGFLEYVARRGKGPLFYDPKKARGGKRENPQYVKVGAKLAEWVRDYAIGDADVAPNHGWRHKFNVDARSVRMDPEVRDAIKGHAPRTEGERYGGNVPLPVKWTEIIRLKRYAVEPPTEPPVLMRVRKKAAKASQSSPPKNAGRPPGRRPASPAAA